ncbi:GDSL esterase/lipase [Actinidia chinensis var. chinensis]|uniref:GDSL esterase/lipase n=1 Tax=Actinidia chinensis var. chinensis TaxID=1590841 RepID=A0A2R6P4Y8_ACTCC|nr:GDSL esterase/lipase [Actinidia chinensis var. chinensis]
MAYSVSQMTFFFFFSLLLLISFSFSEAQKVPAMYVFGDSLVDVGNNNYLKISLVKADFPHNGVDFPGKKSTGRFSNGKNAADFIAEKVGLVTSPPPYLSLLSKSDKGNAFPITGVSFASAGAGIFNGRDELLRQSIPLTEQVEHYTKVYENLVQKLGSAAAQDHLSKSLFTVVIGSNDVLGFFNPGSDQAKKTTPQQFIDIMILALKIALKVIN